MARVAPRAVRGAARRCRTPAAAARDCLAPQAQLTVALPARVGDDTDFYTSLDPALDIGRLINPEDPLTPNFQWIPLAYHGRAPSIDVSGQSLRRPRPGAWGVGPDP